MDRYRERYQIGNVVQLQQVDSIGVFRILRYSRIQNVVEMLTSLFRSLIAAFVLLNALLSGAVAEGLHCSELEQEQQDHTHVHGAAHHGMADAPFELGSSTGTVEYEALGCHSAGVGCPGCIAPVATTSAAFAEARLAYTFSDDVGRSIELANTHRPPIVSI